MRRAPLLLALLPPLLAACDGGSATGGAGGGGSGGAGGAGGAGGSGGVATGGGGTGGTVDVVCGTGDKPLPSGLVALGWDDGVAFSSLRDQNLQITVNGTTYALNDEELHEAVRFDLEHPARVHGFTVRWAGLPEGADPLAEIEAGLYADFGHNGFDFWAKAPLWTGTRCVGEIAAAGGEATYVFDAPIDVPHPGLVYVAHHADVDQPVFAFDESTQGDGTCGVWDDCHSAINMPKVQKSQFWNGVSFPFQNDYLVTLHVEYTDDLTPAERFFQPVDFAAPYAHAAFGDYDDDGWDDLVTDGPTLHHNEGDGTFTDATAASGIAAMGIAGTGGVFGDYDNDGCLDLFVFAESYAAPDSLLRSNCDGTFTDVTAAAGITDLQAYEDCNDPVANVRSPTAGAAWIDLDADGFLDLYEANFICWDKGTNYVDTVWHNEGDGTFVEWTGAHGFTADFLATRGATPADLDGDGDVDLFAHNYRLNPNLYYRNLGGGQFEEVAQQLGLAGVYSAGGYFGHTIGSAIGDLDGDGDLDVVAANLAHPRFWVFSDKTQILLQQEDGTFVDAQGTWPDPFGIIGLRYQETHSVPALADFDHDGALDLIITAVYDGRPTDFYWGNGDATFVLDAYHAGITTENGWGVALSDWDHDGDVDVFATTPFRNERNDPGHWLQVRALGGVTANWAAIGATVRVTAGGKSWLRVVQGGTGKGGQDSMYLHFGLGAAAQVDEIQIVYPGGATTTVGPFGVDQRVWVKEDGATHLGWGPPP